jgi:hypothetical protein
MHHLAATAMRAMVTEMRGATGVDVVSGTSTYRSFERQLAAFDGTNPAKRTDTDGRYIPKPLWGTFPSGALDSDDERSFKDLRWRRRKETAESAVPGTSNHGLGLAVDFDNGQMDRMLDWLLANAARFGFDKENPKERWHWRYHAGDTLPADAQKPVPTIKPPAPPPEEEDMRIVDINPDSQQFARVVVSDRVRWVRGPASTAFEKLNVPRFVVEKAELIGLMQTLGTSGPSPFASVFGNEAPDPELDAVWQSKLA